MKHWRLALVTSLLLLPVTVFFVVGIVALWRSGNLLWLWWMLPICWGTAYLLGRRWRREVLALPGPEFEPPRQWTPQDQAAWSLVEKTHRGVKEISAQQLADPHFYLQAALDLGLELARHYHPESKDPVGSLTIPEILAAAQLALEDSAQWVNEYVPGSHLLTINQWRTLTKAPAWLKAASDASWAVSILLQPANLGRYVTSKLTMDSATRQVRENVLAWFYVMFMRNTGFYIIEMNSGRLRRGGRQYRRLRRQLEDQPAIFAQRPGQAQDTAAEPVEVTLCVVGQVNAGKSSLINALLGKQRAAVDILQRTKRVKRYALQLDDPAARLVLLDTGGYADGSPPGLQLDELRTAVGQADLVLLVVNPTSPTRRADLRLLDHIEGWYTERLHLKPPPTIGVMAHIDALSPVLEWSPPYDWRNPKGTKEQQIADAVEYTSQQFGDRLRLVVPVCTDAQRRRIYGVSEWLLPAIVSALDEARACALLRSLHAELDRGRIRALVRQLSNVGLELWKAKRLGDPRTASREN